MFLDQVRSNFIAQGQQMAAQLNNESEREYLQALANWARNPVGKEPQSPMAVEAVFDFEDGFGMKIKATERPVSKVEAKSFLPKYQTDTDAVGGKVGGPIPGKPGRFYLSASADAFVGELAQVDGRKFIYSGTSPFDKFWVEV
jgi:hypothetical protein